MTVFFIKYLKAIQMNYKQVSNEINSIQTNVKPSQNQMDGAFRGHPRVSRRWIEIELTQSLRIVADVCNVAFGTNCRTKMISGRNLSIGGMR
jgi:hypothetical protein